MRINNNIMALNAHRQLAVNQTNASKSMERLSSGMRINRAGDDAAGLAISEKMRGQIRGLKQAQRNAQDGISLIQTAEGALNESHAILQRMRELAVQSATDTNVNVDRDEIQKEVDELAKELTRISNTTEFNTQNLLGGGLNNVFHVGANQGQNVQLSIGAMDAFSLGVAESQVVNGAFTAGGSGITGTSNFGRGLTAQTYSVKTTKSAAAVSSLSGDVTDTGAISGTFVGDANLVIQVKIDTVSEGNVTAFSYSIDNGANWIQHNSGTGAIGSTGLTWTASAGVTYEVGDVGKIISATATAAEYTAQLFNENGDAVGGAVSFRHSATDVTIGNGSIGETMRISFVQGGISAADDAKQVITTVGSTAAGLAGDGSVQTKAHVAAGINVSTQGAADKAVTTINDAIEKVSGERSKLGAMQNRLEHTIANLGTSAENLQAAESRIRDLDMAEEIMAFTKNNILQQAATAMLAQANMAPQSVLQLLG